MGDVMQISKDTEQRGSNEATYTGRILKIMRSHAKHIYSLWNCTLNYTFSFRNDITPRSKWEVFTCCLALSVVLN